jgi:hypothetical protein
MSKNGNPFRAFSDRAFLTDPDERIFSGNQGVVPKLNIHVNEAIGRILSDVFAASPDRKAWFRQTGEVEFPSVRGNFEVAVNPVLTQGLPKWELVILQEIPRSRQTEKARPVSE